MQCVGGGRYEEGEVVEEGSNSPFAAAGAAGATPYTVAQVIE